jgi:hypothetical protein
MSLNYVMKFYSSSLKAVTGGTVRIVVCLVSSFDALHQSLKLNASEEAADAIVEVIQGKVEP